MTSTGSTAPTPRLHVIERTALAEAVAAAAALIGLLLAARGLFTPLSWVQQGSNLVAVIAVVGILLRLLPWLGARPGLVVSGQALAVGWLLSASHLEGTTTAGLPTLAALRAVPATLGQGVRALQEQPAPVQVDAAVALLLAVTIALLALTLEAVAVGRRAPGAAGVVLLAAYAPIAANTTGGTGFLGFGWVAACWLALLALDRHRRSRGWAAIPTHLQPRAHRPRRWSAQARAVVMAALALLAAAAAPGLVPQAAPTVIGDGLSRLGGEGAGGLRTTLDVSAQLTERSDATVLVYTSTFPRRIPLRVDVLTDYRDGRWQPRESTTPMAPILPGLPAALDARELRSATPRLAGEITVSANSLRAPQLALPGVATALDVGRTVWAAESNGIVHVESRPRSYRASVTELDPPPESFGLRRDEGQDPALLAVAGEATPALDAVLAQLDLTGATPARSAAAIEEYLRGPDFSYSLDLSPTLETDAAGRPLSPDPLTQFLATRRGYCVQFSTAMVHLARRQGIPARVAIGYLPGTASDGTFTVRGRDAHAWPELWFPEVGWLRYEPTPGDQSGAAPPWSAYVPTTPAASAAADPGEQTSAGSPTERPEIPDEQTAAAGAAPKPAAPWATQARPYAVALALLALLALGVPSVRRLRELRAMRRARDEAERVDLLWEQLLTRLRLLGWPHLSALSPREAARQLRAQGLAAGRDDPAYEALRRAVRLVEHARYAPDGDRADAAAMARVCADLLRTARTQVGRRRRLLAWWGWPQPAARA